MIDEKKKLRKLAKEIRKTLDIPAVSSVLAAKICSHEAYISAKNVMLYYPVGSEYNFLQLLDDDSKNFYFPKVCAENLLVCPYSKDSGFVKSPLNIMEPCSEPVPTSALDLIIVPALMADKNGYRLGYGGGFYDRFIPQTKAKTICAISSKLCTDSMPATKDDIPVDFVITD